MLNNAMPEPIQVLQSDEKEPTQNLNFNMLFLAAECGLIDLEDASDILLSSSSALGYKRGAYSQRQLDRKIRNEQRRLPRIDEFGIPSEVSEYLLNRQIDELVDVGNLTALQEIIFRLCASGLTCTEIAKKFGLSRRRTYIALKIARRKVRVAYEEGKYAGWYEVYLSEVRRKG